MDKVLQAAQPFLKDRVIKDFLIGLTLIACELDNGDVGVAYVLREELARGCLRIPLFQDIVGRPAAEVAGLILNGTDVLQRGAAISVLTAAAQQVDIPMDNSSSLFGLSFQPEDRVAMIGLVSPVARIISRDVKNLFIFDKGLPLDGVNPLLSPMEMQAEILPACDIVLISGSAAINNSIDSLLALCGQAREVVLMGPSTPMFPEGYRDSRITRLAGSFWARGHKKEIFKAISLAGGHGMIEEYMLKKMVLVG
ncbi:MAG: hypothetical protein IT308_08845 [Anaerolineaceae bacterium]|nr:hypothetical protein [Anaerolineaceae bacterium]